MDKKKVAIILEEIGTLLEITGESPFKCRAYFTGARVIEQLEGDLSAWVDSGRLKEIRGIGKALASKITELVTTGRLEYYERLKASVPPGLVEMLRIPQLGPKKIKALYDGLGISSVRELEYACKENRLIDLPGFGLKTQENILQGIELIKRFRGQYLYSEVISIARGFIDTLNNYQNINRLSIAGSLRRRKETVGNIDIVAALDDSKGLIEYLTHLGEIEEVVIQDHTKCDISLKIGLRVNLWIVKDQVFPFTLHYLTGSRGHNSTLARKAREIGFEISPEGLFYHGKSVSCREEEDIYTALGLGYIPPELREDTGEIEAAAQGNLPQLLELNDIKGIFHIHSNYSDGRMSLEEIAHYVQDKGLQYVGISDHSQSAQYAHGLKIADLERQHREIDHLNKSLQSIRLLKGIEVDILPDGSLDYEDAVLAQFDFVIAAVHSRFRMSQEEMTNRIIRALSHPQVTILAHPTGRLLLARDPYPVDIYKVVDAAAKFGKLIEINASPYRLDLDWRLCKYAKEKGVRLCIGPDAHGLEGLEDTIYGVNVARRGWLGPDRVINSLSIQEIESFLHHLKSGNKGLPS
jgi:DNA polymerase (family 10)